jgi:hypothetical protein
LWEQQQLSIGVVVFPEVKSVWVKTKERDKEKEKK